MIIRKYWVSREVQIELDESYKLILSVPSVQKKITISNIILQVISDTLTENIKGLPRAVIFNGDYPQSVECFLEEHSILRIENNINDDQFEQSGLSVAEWSVLKFSQIGGVFTESKSNCKKTILDRNDSVNSIKLNPTSNPTKKNLWKVLSDRRSSKPNLKRTISLNDLETFINYSFKSRNSLIDGVDKRFFPSSGACHPIKLYIIPNRVDSIERNLYSYDVNSHALINEDLSCDIVQQIISSTYNSAARTLDSPPGILFFFMARPELTSNKYSHSALSLIFKDVGCITQQYYLLTQGLELEGCAFSGADFRLIEKNISESDLHFVGGYWLW